MSYFVNNFNQEIAYKFFKGKSPGIVFIHGLNSDMKGLKATSIEKYAKKKVYHICGLTAEGMENHMANLKNIQFLTGKKI